MVRIVKLDRVFIIEGLDSALGTKYRYSVKLALPDRHKHGTNIGLITLKQPIG
jgi:hypothetical protein